MWMKRILVLLLLVVSCAALAVAETRVGTVISVIGSVSIDAFGKGAFIAAVKGDDLYASSVVKTGANGRATLNLQGSSSEVVPGATVKVSEFAAASAKKGGLKWFAAFGKLVKSLADASQLKEADAVLGTRAAEVESAEIGEMEWAVEGNDATVLIHKARKSIEEGDYASALEKLDKAESAETPAVAWQLSFWKGYCYFQVEDYPDAAKHLSVAYEHSNASSAKLGTVDERALLLFQLGSSRYLIGNEKEAVTALNAYLKEFPDGQFAQYARQLLAAIPR
jgi:tetratricopeptide (TPR) repeat protein